MHNVATLAMQMKPSESENSQPKSGQALMLQFHLDSGSNQYCDMMLWQYCPPVTRQVQSEPDYVQVLDVMVDQT